MSILNQINELQKEQRSLLKVILNTKEMIRGKYKEGTRKCGKKNCYCANGEGHIYRRVHWAENGQPHTKNISKNDVVWIKKLTDNYGNFRRSRQRLREIEDEINILLNHLESDIITNTAKMKKFPS